MIHTSHEAADPRDIAFIAWKGQPIRTCRASEVSYRHAGWSWGGTLGQPAGPVKDDASWRFPGYGAKRPDVRRLPAEALAELARIDAEIKRLGALRTAYIADNFRTWPLLKRDEVRNVEGRTLAQIKEQYR